MATDRNHRLQEVSAPGTPTSGSAVVYVKSDGMMYWKDDGGTEHAVISGSAGVVMMANLPTADPHVVGQLYTATGAVKVSAG